MKPLLSALIATGLLTACNNPLFPGIQGDVNGKEFLSGLEGPNVPSVDKTLFSTAQEQEKSGNYAGAAQIYKQLLDKNPDNRDYAYAMAEALRRYGELDQAIGIYDKIILNDPAFVPALEGKGLALLSKADFNRAGEALAQVQNRAAARWRTLNGLGILFSAQKRHAEARQYFAQALEASPNNPSILNNMGLVFALEQDFDQAGERLRQAAALMPSGTPGRKRIDLNMALVHAAAGRLSDAKAIASQYYSGPALDNNMGLYAHLAKDDALAKTYFNMALTDSKTHYSKAWQNLDNISKAEAPATPPAGAKRVRIAPAEADTAGEAAASSWADKLKPLLEAILAGNAVPAQKSM